MLNPQWSHGGSPWSPGGSPWRRRPVLQIRIILMKIRICQDADQQGNEMLDPDPHQNKKSDPYQYRSDKPDPCSESDKDPEY